MNRWLDYIIILLVNWTTYLTSFSFNFGYEYSSLFELLFYNEHIGITFKQDVRNFCISYTRPKKHDCDYNNIQIYTNKKLDLHFNK